MVFDDLWLSLLAVVGVGVSAGGVGDGGGGCW